MSLKTLEHAKECSISLGEFSTLETREHEELQCLCMDYMYENTELRELVADLWMQLLNAYDRKEVDEFADRIRELGIEVDG